MLREERTCHLGVNEEDVDVTWWLMNVFADAIHRALTDDHRSIVHDVDGEIKNRDVPGQEKHHDPAMLFPISGSNLMYDLYLPRSADD